MDRECRVAGRGWVLSTGWCQGSDPRLPSTQSSGAAWHNQCTAGEGTHLLWRSRLEQLTATEGRVRTSPAEWGRHELFWQWVGDTYSALHCVLLIACIHTYIHVFVKRQKLWSESEVLVQGEETAKAHWKIWYDTMRYEIVYLGPLKSWWKGQLNLAHSTKSGKNKEESKKQKPNVSKEKVRVIVVKGRTERDDIFVNV